MKIRTTIAAALGALAAGAFIAAAPATAAPSFCDNHGTGPGLIYKAACAVGDGGGGNQVEDDDCSCPGHCQPEGSEPASRPEA